MIMPKYRNVPILLERSGTDMQSKGKLIVDILRGLNSYCEITETKPLNRIAIIWFKDRYTRAPTYYKVSKFNITSLGINRYITKVNFVHYD